MEKKLPLLSTEKNKKEIDSLILLKLLFLFKKRQKFVRTRKGEIVLFDFL
jgi:hypothetical protein